MCPPNLDRPARSRQGDRIVEAMMDLINHKAIQFNAIDAVMD